MNKIEIGNYVYFKEPANRYQSCVNIYGGRIIQDDNITIDGKSVVKVKCDILFNGFLSMFINQEKDITIDRLYETFEAARETVKKQIRVGDYVYFKPIPDKPIQGGRIIEETKAITKGQGYIYLCYKVQYDDKSEHLIPADRVYRTKEEANVKEAKRNQKLRQKQDQRSNKSLNIEHMSLDDIRTFVVGYKTRITGENPIQTLYNLIDVMYNNLNSNPLLKIAIKEIVDEQGYGIDLY